jgi:hypothetical protein
MWTIGPLTFMVPWALAASALLPFLWWLLKTMPPAPRRLDFPAVRLLFGLVARDQTAARTPWWLVALRILLALVAILAAAHPVSHASRGAGPLLLVVDDDWAAARLWPQRQAVLLHLVEEAERAAKPVRLLTTAAPADGTPTALVGPMAAADAKAVIEALAPKPWSADRKAARQALEGVAGGADRVVWVVDGLAGPDDDAFSARLKAFGRLEIVVPPPTARAHLLLPPPAAGRNLTAKVRRVPEAVAETLSVRARDIAGRVLGAADVALPAGLGEAEAALVLPDALRNRVARLDLDGEDSAGAVALLDDRWRRHPVGLIDQRAGGNGGSPLLDDLFYIERALGPGADARRGRVRELLDQDLAMAVLPDLGSLPDDDRTALTAWIEKGGVLLRLGGPKLAQTPDALLPVSLLNGGRMLGGAMSWTHPMALAPMPTTGPFAGLAVADDIRVGTQLLAEPDPELDERTWARLADGTPLVTGRAMGKGWLVLIHTTVGPAWSNLGLSGLLPAMVERLMSLSQGFASAASGRPLPPAEVLDGFGHLTAPSGTVEALSDRPTAVGPRHPPGYYGEEPSRRALNLGSDVPPLADFVPPSGVRPVPLGDGVTERDLQPPLLEGALLLLFADLLAVLYLRGRLSRRGLAAVVLVVAAAAAAGPVRAQPDSERQAALQTRLAYVQTGNPSVDEASRAGLEGLSRVIEQRTTVSLGEPVGLDVGRDALMVYPLLYWAVPGGQGPLTDAERDKVNDFMRNGGLILFDTLDGGRAGSDRLRQLATGLDIPPLTEVTGDHVLTHTFYILRTMPGRLEGAPVYAAEQGDPANDNVSPVVVGAADWAGAWAMDRRGDPLYAVVPGGEQQREMAYRFGVNLVMYALTGSYKADQVHLPAIWERLKR